MAGIHDFEPLWGNWKIEGKPLGAGGSGITYKAKRSVLGYTSYCAIKRISIPASEQQLVREREFYGTDDDEQLHEHFRAEIEDRAKEYVSQSEFAGNRHIVQVYDVQDYERQPGPGFDLFIRMELLNKLQDRMDMKTPDERTVIRLGLDICDALKEMHGKNVVHRDIKPANILVAEDGTFKLADFGSALVLEHGATTMTRSLTPEYAAPELLKNEKADHRVDIYSLGLVLYQLLNEDRLPSASFKLPAPARASRKLAEVVLKACAYEPEDRYSTAAEMKAALEDLYTPSKNESKSKHLQWIAIAAAVLALAFGGWCLGTRQPAPEPGSMAAKIGTLTAEVEAQRRQNEALTTGNAEKDKQINTLTTQSTEKDTQITVLTKDIVDKATQIETLNADVAEKTIQIEKLTADIAGKETQIANLIASGAEKDQQIATLTAEVAASAQQVEALKNEKTQLTATIDALNAETAKKQARDADYQVGQYVTFGTYPQSGSGTDQTLIEWQVLAREGNSALLISRYALDAKPYNEQYTDVTWETCTLRDWLNNDFINAAFTPAQQNGIETRTVDNSQAQGASWSVDGGNNTQDKVFLLSYVEAEKYFANDEARKCIPTAYAVKNGAWQDDGTEAEYKLNGQVCCWWWLRSPGDQLWAVGVHTEGSPNWNGVVNYTSGSVRPALWINLESGIF